MYTTEEIRNMAMYYSKHDIEAYLAAFLDVDLKDVGQYTMKMRSKTLSEEI